MISSWELLNLERSECSILWCCAWEKKANINFHQFLAKNQTFIISFVRQNLVLGFFFSFFPSFFLSFFLFLKFVARNRAVGFKDFLRNSKKYFFSIKISKKLIFFPISEFQFVATGQCWVWTLIGIFELVHLSYNEQNINKNWRIKH